MFNIEEIIEKWEKIGLLDGLLQNQKRILALKYELAAHCVIDNDVYADNHNTVSCLFPIIYRVYSSGKKIGDIESFVREVHEFFVNNSEMMQDLNGYFNIDSEAEMCALFVERYKWEENFEPIKWINKHKL